MDRIYLPSPDRKVNVTVRNVRSRQCFRQASGLAKVTLEVRRARCGGACEGRKQSMTEAPSAPGATSRGRERPAGEAPCYGALDLGTNNCRLLIATPQGNGGFRVVEAYSRIVRLGEGLTQSGRLSEAAMDRALAALKVSAEKLRRRRVLRLRAIATQACRMAENGPAFIERVFEETGLRLQIIAPQEEARLSVAGCLNLIDRTTDAALVVDVGGGSTELSWVDLKGPPPTAMPPLRAWLSVPIGAGAQQACSGSDRADLVLAGAASLQAVQELWPCSRVRVADRGLREGILLSLMSDRGGRRRRRRRGGIRPMAAQ